MLGSAPPTGELRQLAKEIRLVSLRTIARGNSSHIGTVFSCVETLACLYGAILRVRPAEPDWPDRDRFVMSKGHGAAGLYATLALRGFFPREPLDEFCVDGGSLYGHVTHRGVPGVDVSTGALGHGLAVAVGLAAGALRLRAAWRVFALLSDGECDEGSTWEAALFAAHHGLSNLSAIVDYNRIQGLGLVSEVVELAPFADKWSAFGWTVRELDGHNHEALRAALGVLPFTSGKPSCLIAHTTKGKGVSFMENTVLWHYRSPAGEELDQALKEVEGAP